jgi:hypothetical protein
MKTKMGTRHTETGVRPPIRLGVTCRLRSDGFRRAAATALAEAIREQQRPWNLDLVSIQDVFEPIAFIRKCTGISMQDVYNIMLRRGWTLCSSQLTALAHGAIRMTHNSLKVLERCWEAHRPNLVVSLIPHYNRAMKQALDAVRPGTPYVTLLTDIADYPPHFWIEPMDQW